MREIREMSSNEATREERAETKELSKKTLTVKVLNMTTT
jgi:hypothetical protein